jgi:peptidoglycan DL-endopeptidase CwlO
MTRPPPPSARLCRLLLLAAASLAWACATVRPPAPAGAAPLAAAGDGTAAPPAGPSPAPQGPAAAEPPAGEPLAGAASEPGAAPLEPAPDEGPAAPRDDRTELRQRILAAARRLLGHHPHLDCSGYVLAAFRGAGLRVVLPPHGSRSQALLAAGGSVGSPQPGDLALFHDTYDRNRNGKVDDGITHVALVEAVDGDQVTLLHRGRRVERLRMNLASPSDRTLNDQVRYRRRRDPAQVRTLTGELFTTYAALPEGEVTEPPPPSPARRAARAR